MSDVPSWLTEENISTAAKVAQENPALTKAAINAAASQAPPPPPPPPTAAPPKPPKNSTQDVETGYASRPTETGSPSELIIDEAELKEMQKWHLALRLGYIGAAIFLAAASALSLQNQKDVGLAFFAFYVFFFSALICCFEVALNVRPTLSAVEYNNICIAYKIYNN
jgi:hypothetical protein